MAKNNTSFNKDTNKPKGRPKGVLNKITTDVKTAVSNIVENRLLELDTDLNNMSATSKWMVLIQLMKFAYPTLSSTKLDANISNNGAIEFVIKYENTLPPVNGGDKIIEI
ncbi:hypothetical protein [Pedobacter steynii]